jgi:hypothetical protein
MHHSSETHSNKYFTYLRNQRDLAQEHIAAASVVNSRVNDGPGHVARYISRHQSQVFLGSGAVPSFFQDTDIFQRPLRASPAVTLADGKRLPTSGTANVVVRRACGSICMPNSVRAPRLKSLLSVFETAQQFDILFQAQRAYIVQKQPAPLEGESIATATQIGGMHRLDVAKDISTPSAATSALDLCDWHLRLGHPYTSAFRQAVREQIVFRLPKTLQQATI